MSDNDNDMEKPLKKARYVWQVKGKYHLKDSLKNKNTMSINNNLESSACTSSVSSSKIEQPHCIETKIAAIKKCCVASVLATTEAIMDEIAVDNSSRRIQAIQNTSNLPPSKRERQRSANEYDFINKWQALQRAKCFVDNTVNIVIENWMNSSSSHSREDDYDLLGLNLFDISKFQNGQLEDDAILMAIQSHGLSCAPDYYKTNGNFTEDNLTNMHTELGRMETVFTEGQYDSNQQQGLNGSSMNYLQQEEVGRMKTVVTEAEYNVNQDKDLDESSMDFLQQAVSAAIQEKGLLY